uniref:Uncharacterized protein n=1 Tax=Arundo donax TaxID=35708 RepID=A0A0A9EU57_ARUDO
MFVCMPISAFCYNLKCQVTNNSMSSCTD